MWFIYLKIAVRFTPEAQELYTHLINQKIKVGRQDLRIAAIVLSVDGILVTRNNRDFSQVPNLVLENWTL
ncbi:MAG: type II toxin-antitoxin system VapC family toxin [Desmonostoc geniculatum HA4340-LM1]|nr:type II toxin-antitoxin system VapC family toxin [Desmonostoc geniculatum HA4340-LM1]